jgi:hypothetical protein
MIAIETSIKKGCPFDILYKLKCEHKLIVKNFLNEAIKI